MLKRYFFLGASVCNLWLDITAAGSRDTIRVTIQCAQTIDAINSDMPILFNFLSDILNDSRKRNGDVPSNVFSNLMKFKIENEEPVIDHIATLRLQKKPSFYINTFIIPFYPKMNHFFFEKFKETENLEETWYKFIRYLKNEILAPNLIKYKRDLVDASQKNVALKSIVH